MQADAGFGAPWPLAELPYGPLSPTAFHLSIMMGSAEGVVLLPDSGARMADEVIAESHKRTQGAVYGLVMTSEPSCMDCYSFMDCIVQGRIGIFHTDEGLAALHGQWTRKEVRPWICTQLTLFVTPMPY